MKSSRVAKVTISIPEKLLELADKMAQEQEISRSEVVARLLKKAEKDRIEALMAEGYKEMAEENSRLAEEAFPLVSETILKYTEWDEAADDQAR